MRERVDGGGCAVAFEEEDDLALADEDVVPLEPQTLDVEGRPLLDEPPGRLGGAALDAKLGYVDAGVDPVRVSGVITLRGRPFEVDDTLVYLTKSL